MPKKTGIVDGYQTTRYNYNLKGGDNSNNTTGDLLFDNTPAIIESKVVSCRNYVYQIPYYSDETYSTYYYFYDRVLSDEALKESVTLDGEDRKNWLGWLTDAGKAVNAAIENHSIYELVSEAYVLNSDAPEPDTTLYYVQRATQAAGTDKYIKIMIYANVVLLQSDNKVTVLEKGLDTFKEVTRDETTGEISSGAPKTIYINTPEAQPSIDEGSNLTYYFKENNIRYTFSTTKDGENVNKYEITDEEVELSSSNNKELCDEIMPETAVVLREVIQYGQFLVPVFLIILTAVDIGKIVVTGNIDEELPKQKKKIITRIIVAIVFFFLPFFAQLMTDLLIDSNAENTDTIAIIDCLFEE